MPYKFEPRPHLPHANAFWSGFRPTANAGGGRARRFCWLRMPARATRRSPGASGWAARLSIGPSAASSLATRRRHSAKSRAPEQTPSCPANRRPCWSPRPVQVHPRAAPAGRWNSWLTSWLGSPLCHISGAVELPPLEPHSATFNVLI